MQSWEPACLGAALALCTIVGCQPKACPPPITSAAASGQRCAADDSACGPEPFRAQCLEQTDYSRNAPRVPFAPQPQREGDECAYDGECADSGCGYQCLSLRSGGNDAFTCEGRPDVEEQLEDAY